MSYMASQITSISTVWSVVCSGAHQRKHQTSALLAFVRGNHRRPVNSPHKGPVTRKMFPFDDVIMIQVDEFDTKYSKPARPVIKRGIDFVLYPIPLSLNSMYVWHVSISRFNQTVFCLYGGYQFIMTRHIDTGKMKQKYHIPQCINTYGIWHIITGTLSIPYYDTCCSNSLARMACLNG